MNLKMLEVIVFFVSLAIINHVEHQTCHVKWSASIYNKVYVTEDPQSLVFVTPLKLTAIIGLLILKVHGYTNEQLLAIKLLLKRL